MTDAQRALHALLDLADPPEMRQRRHTLRLEGKPDPRGALTALIKV